MAELRSRFTYSNVVATLALFLALTGGVAWALKSNSVKSRHIKNGQVRAADIATDAVRAPEVAAGAIAAPEILDGSVGAAEIGDGQVGTADQGVVPAARVARAGSLFGIVDSTPTSIPFTAEAYDTANLHDTAINSTRLTAPVAGIYRVSGFVEWAPDAERDASYRLAITLLGGTVAKVSQDDVTLPLSEDTAQHVSAVVKLSAGHYVELSVFQDNADNDAADIRGGASGCGCGPAFEMIWLSPAQ